MVGCANRVSGLKSAARLRQSGLKVKTTQAIDSNDWRKRAAGVSSPGEGTRMSKQSYDHNDDICIQMELETDDSFSGPQYRYPKDKKAAWESVISAPVWQLPSSSPSTSGDDTKEAVKIQLKQVRPILTSVNGQGIALPNRFCFDVSAVDPQDAPSDLALGELKRLNGPAAFRRVSSEDSDEILVELQEMLSENRDTQNSAGSNLSASHDQLQEIRAHPKHHGSAFEIPGAPVPETRPRHAGKGPSNEEEDRFQRMLNRLQNKHEPPPPARETNGPAASSRHIVDPAIVAMKLKDDPEPPSRSTQHEPSAEVARKSFVARLDRLHNYGKLSSTDSGYASNMPDRGSGDRRSRDDSRDKPRDIPKEHSVDDNQIKTLNPAAAEFKSATPTDATPWLSPKKLSRPPLANIFPEAMPSHTPLTAVREGIPFQRPQQTKLPVPTETTQKSRAIGNGTLTRATIPGPRPSELALPINGMAPNGFPSTSTLPHHVITPMGLSATMSAAAFASSPFYNTMGNVPSTATLNAPISVSPLSLPAMNGFNTFPPGGGASVPAYVPGVTAGVNPCLPHTAPFIPGASLQSSIGPERKLDRPYFPVTVKPRDHDPVKQQMYEAYLEWRKANEPGYHMKCKMRQANRVMRQCQQKQEIPLASNPDNWKAIAEKAKAAVGAAAAAAAAEKRMWQESVREELRVKVRELSRDSQRVAAGM
ncbi:hypothetical protein CHGG_00564 [Chaetomium globosum CBS 148.51]|uniref:Uncharacterized protein n=1 Tax=Chaetomium globosum (strain ATCC 6205 / CBS 148.51 / DSM 1962 / NBRC 6347 / NRRL 1970) TaxID=306901 RepID=Q2HGU0_CHAGB|nr:uncharacterized protein CHGG_00564 [Chaetomium globosum CBS 148.51]EAQ92329.1 hypothetical protein CHGG_00564 [Chaetomium globosum CBS 148.51]